MGAIVGWLDEFLWGSFVIFKIFLVSLLLCVSWGLIGAAAKLSPSRLAQRLAATYTTVFRATPELLVLLIVYYGSAVTLTTVVQLFSPDVKFVDIPPFWAGAFAISLIVGAYATETFRGAFLGVDYGQIEAARALGLSTAQTFFYVRMPQMWRLALPTFGNHMNSLVKDTALVSVIGLEEIMFTAEMATTVTNQPFTMYLIVAIIYLAFTSIVVASVASLERYANRHLEKAR